MADLDDKTLGLAAVTTALAQAVNVPPDQGAARRDLNPRIAPRLVNAVVGLLAVLQAARPQNQEEEVSAVVIIVLTAPIAVVTHPLTVAARRLTVSIGHLVAAEEVVTDRPLLVQRRLPLQANAALTLIAIVAAPSLSGPL